MFGTGGEPMSTTQQPPDLECLQVTRDAGPPSIRPRESVLRRWLGQLGPSLAEDRSEAAVIVVRFDNSHSLGDVLGEQSWATAMKHLKQRVHRAAKTEHEVVDWTREEFAVLVSAVTAPRQLHRLAARIRKGLQDPLTVAGMEILPLATIAAVRIDHRTVGHSAEILDRLDQALQRAARGGGDRFAVHDHRYKRTPWNRLELQNSLRAAMEGGELRLAYQPIVDLMSGRVSSVEALARWTDERLGEVPPEEFFPAAEDAGMGGKLEKWVIRTACAQLAEWRRLGHFDLVMSVNISASQFGSREFGLEEPIYEALSRSGIPPAALQIELAETALCESAERTMLRSMRRMIGLGVRFVIDDFGTGYSSLSRLHRLPVQGIKIDRSFVAGLPRNQCSYKIVAAIIALAEALDLEVFAEGVERHTQRKVLAELGCKVAQGYLFARPLEASDVPSYLQGRTNGAPSVEELETARTAV